MVSFVHYGDNRMESDDVVLLKVGHWHIQYNRAKLYNVDVEEPNTVTVTSASSDFALSERSAALQAGESYSETINPLGHSLMVAICEMVEMGDSEVDYAVIRIYQGLDGMNLCDKPVDENRVVSPLLVPSMIDNDTNTKSPAVLNRDPDIIVEKEDDDESSLSDLVRMVVYVTVSSAVVFVIVVLLCIRRANKDKSVVKKRTSKEDKDFSDTELMDSSNGSSGESIIAEVSTTTKRVETQKYYEKTEI